VYPDLRILEATRRLIDAQATRRIPQDNRILVEHATHPDALAAVAESGGPDWQAHQQSIEGRKGGERSLGHLNALAFHKTFCDAPFANNDEIIATRLGAADRLLEFNPPLAGPFGASVKQMALRHHLLPKDLPADLAPVIIAADDNGFEFELIEAHYRYSRLGIERLPSNNR
jgi:CRISPR-associated endonuclease/helicase Cas3